MININELLDLLWSSVIEKFNIDMKEHTIKLLINSHENTEKESFDIILEDVVAFSWINESFHQNKDRLDIEKWNFISLESIGYENSTKVIVRGGEWKNNFSASPNIVLELWNSIFLVEAKKITINGKTYDLIENK